MCERGGVCRGGRHEVNRGSQPTGEHCVCECDVQAHYCTHKAQQLPGLKATATNCHTTTAATTANQLLTRLVFHSCRPVHVCPHRQEAVDIKVVGRHEAALQQGGQLAVPRAVEQRVENDAWMCDIVCCMESAGTETTATQNVLKITSRAHSDGGSN